MATATTRTNRPAVQITTGESNYGTPGYITQLVFPDGRKAARTWSLDWEDATRFAEYLEGERGSDDWAAYLDELTFGSWVAWKGGAH